MLSLVYSQTQQRKKRVMNTTNTLINTIGPMHPSQWILPVLLALALVSVSLSLTGCPSPHH
jgi:hypothetical protein